MNDQAPRSVLVADRNRLAKASHQASFLARTAKTTRRAVLVSALAGLALMSACSLSSGNQSAGDRACADKLVREMSTNVAVKGLWGCIDHTLQQTLRAYGSDGDAAFVNPQYGAVPAGVITSHYAAEQNGVVVYTAVIKGSGTSPAHTLVIVVWTDSDGKISNVTVATPNF